MLSVASGRYRSRFCIVGSLLLKFLLFVQSLFDSLSSAQHKSKTSLLLAEKRSTKLRERARNQTIRTGSCDFVDHLALTAALREQVAAEL
jgi:hypothetical protein